MATVAEQRETAAPPGAAKLAFFYSARSGRCRRVEGFVAQVLQRRQNHDTFTIVRVAQEEYPELFERFGVERVPTLVVIEDRKVEGRLESPRNCREIEKFLAPWLK
jgi:thioredoxin-like negative regulator of GroEL